MMGTFFCIVGVALQTAAVNSELYQSQFQDTVTNHTGSVGMFLAGRFIIGMGIPFAIAGASALIAELTYPSERAVIGGLFNESWCKSASYQILSLSSIPPLKNPQLTPINRRRLHHGRRNNPRNLLHVLRLVVAAPLPIPNNPLLPTTHLHLVHPRIPTMVSLQGPRRRSLLHPSEISR